MTYTSQNFTVSAHQIDTCQANLTHSIHYPAFHTKALPCTLVMLEKYIPTIFENQCFNDQKRSFKSEACDTEVGHLFEHIIIENLKILYCKKFGDAEFSGITTWDWQNDSQGTFNITITAENIDPDLYEKALEKSIYLMESIYENEKRGTNPAFLSKGTKS